MKSVFDLIERKEDLRSSNQGMTDLYYNQVLPLRNISDSRDVARFGNGIITFRFSPAPGKWWLPSKTYWKLRYKLTKGDSSVLTLDDNISPTMDLCSSLFSKQKFKINDKDISEISEHITEVNCIKHRLSKSGSWLRTTGNSLNFWETSFSKRQNAVCSNSLSSEEDLENRLLSGPFVQWRNIVNYNAGDTLRFTYTHAAGQSAFIFVDTLVATRVLFRAGGLANGDIDPALVAAGIIPGNDIVYIVNENRHISRIIAVETAGPASPDANDLNRILIQQSIETEVDVPAAADPANGLFSLNGLLGNIPPRRVSENELIYRPPLSIMDVSHAIPGGAKMEFDFTPFSNTVYQKNAIESLGVDKIPGIGVVDNDFRFEVVSFELYVAQCEGPLLPDAKDYMLDLQEVRCQIDTIESKDRTQTALDVLPSTTALSAAFQDSSAGGNTLFPLSKFRIRNNEQNNLISFYIRYGGLQKPQPDYSLEISENKDLAVEVFGRNLLYSNKYWDSDNETIEEFRDRGLFLHFQWPVTASSRETRVYVSTSFSSLTPGISPRLLLFNHYDKVVIIKTENGSVTQVLSSDT